jgi:hypothetical protein
MEMSKVILDLDVQRSVKAQKIERNSPARRSSGWALLRRTGTGSRAAARWLGKTSYRMLTGGYGQALILSITQTRDIEDGLEIRDISGSCPKPTSLPSLLKKEGPGGAVDPEPFSQEPGRICIRSPKWKAAVSIIDGSVQFMAPLDQPDRHAFRSEAPC